MGAGAVRGPKLSNFFKDRSVALLSLPRLLDPPIVWKRGRRGQTLWNSTGLVATQQGCLSPPTWMGKPQTSSSTPDRKKGHAVQQCWPRSLEAPDPPSSETPAYRSWGTLPRPSTACQPSTPIPSGHSFQLTFLLTRTENREWRREDEG